MADGGLFGTKASFAPLAGARAGEDLRIGSSKQEVKDAPSLDADRELSQEEEARLYAHYGLDYSEPRSDTGMPRGERAARTPGRMMGALKVRDTIEVILDVSLPSD